MDRKKLEQIAGYYETGKGKYQRNKRFSKGGHEVYTVPPFQDLWLSFRELAAGEILATKTDGHGVIQSWDTYSTAKDHPALLNMERLAGDGETHILFSRDERDVIRQLGEPGKEDIRRNLDKAIRTAGDRAVKDQLAGVRDKLERLPEGSCGPLVDFVGRCTEGRGKCSIRRKLDSYRAETRQKGHGKQVGKRQEMQR